MTNPVTITLANGQQAQITGSGQGSQASISFQLLTAAGQPIGGPQLLAQGHGFEQGPISTSLDAQNFAVTALANGGFELAFNLSTGDTQGFTTRQLIGVGVDPAGHIVTDGSPGAVLPAHNFAIQLDDPAGRKLSGAAPTVPQLHELGGGRFAVVYETFDARDAPSTHVGFGVLKGLYSDTAVVSRPDTISEASGAVTLTWREGGETVREVFSLDGTVLAARGVSHTFTVGVAGSAGLDNFDVAHDQLILTNADGSVAHGAASTLTFDVRTHALTWDQDSEGPAPASTAALLNVDHLGVANFADSFRPAVFKMIAEDGSTTIQWYDSDHIQTWDTLRATRDAAGRVTTYASTLDDGTSTVFNFDVTNTQPYNRYVDQNDPAGRVVVRSVLLDDGQSWVATFTRAGDNGAVVSYTVDSFDAGGRLVGHGLFHADGTPF